jgi:hypothetical protein
MTTQEMKDRAAKRGLNVVVVGDDAVGYSCHLVDAQSGAFVVVPAGVSLSYNAALRYMTRNCELLLA